MDKFNMRKTKNRRASFRVYDEVYLSYKKIDQTWANNPRPLPDNIERSFSTDMERAPQDSAALLPKLDKDLPDLQFNGHESHNVNISATGMAFNCDEVLKEGDILAIKIQLASSMAIIVTYSRVVYCKSLDADDSPSDSTHSCFVGAHFVDMEKEDRELLTKHVDKKRGVQHWVNGAILAAVITVLAAPDVVFGLLLEFVHFLFELLLHILHLSFEFIEMNLDHLIEHLFSTDLHQTQVIVFYVIFSVLCYGFYLLVRKVPSFYRRCKQNLFSAYAFKKASLVFFWREQSLFNKFKIAVIVAMAIAGYLFFGM